MKIALVLLNEAVANLNKGWVSTFGRMAYAPTTLTQLAALVPESLNAIIEIYDEGVSVFDPNCIEADLVGISVLTSNAPRAYEFSNILRSRGITVVLGGVHTTLMPNEAGLHADSIVIGYAEKSWPQLLLDFNDKKLKNKYDEEDLSIFTSNLPIPRYDLLPKRKYILPITLEATRGCKNYCNFCVISGCANYSHFLRRDISSVVNHILNTKARHFTFLDSSPTEDPEFIKALYKALIPLKIRWHSTITLKVAEDEEWLKLAEESGCNGVLIGFESLNQESLSQGNKNFNQVNRFKNAINNLHRHHISVLGCFVFGFDCDEPDIFKRTVNFVNEAKIDILNYTILTPYPSTSIFHELDIQGRIIDRNWEHYSGTKVVFQPGKMTVAQLQKGYEWASLKTYSLNSIARRLFPFRNSFVQNLVSNTYFSIYNKMRFN